MIKKIPLNLTLIIFYFSVVLLILMYGLNISEKNESENSVDVEDMYWATAQLQINIVKFKNQLLIAKLENNINDSLIESYNILFSRFFILKNTREIEKEFSDNSDYNKLKKDLENYLTKTNILLEERKISNIDIILKKIDELDMKMADFSVIARNEEVRHRTLQIADIEKKKNIIYIAFFIILLGITVITAYLFIKNKKNTQEIKEKDHLIKLQQEARKSAIESETIKEEFFGSVTHELKSPLQRIMANVELLKGEKIREKNQINCINKINEATLHLVRLIDDLLKLTVLGAKKIKITNSLLNFTDLINEACIYYKKISENKNVKFYFENKKDINIVCDKIRIKQIIYNILSNSIKYTNHGEITVKSEIFSHSESMANLHILVKDSGIGIPKDYLDKVFLPFVRVPDRKREGHGLGLSITRGIVELLSGKINIESELGKGTEVNIFLPVKVLTESKLILVVDDDKNILEAICSGLSDSQYTIDKASSIDEACKLISEKDYRAILLDIELHDGKSHSILDFANKKYKHGFLAVAMTACERYFNEEKYQDFDNILLKPIELSDIKEALGIEQNKIEQHIEC